MEPILEEDLMTTPNELISKMEQNINMMAHHHIDLKILFVYMKVINKHQLKITPSILDIEPSMIEMGEMIDIILHSVIYLRTLHKRQSPLMPIIPKMEKTISKMNIKMHLLYTIYTLYMEQINLQIIDEQESNYTHEMNLVIIDINQAISNIKYYLDYLKNIDYQHVNTSIQHVNTFLEEDDSMPLLEEDNDSMPLLEED